MPFVAGSLADGQLPSSAGDLYTAPADTVVYVKRISFFNTNSVEQTIIIWVQRSGGTARKWRQYVLAQNESADLLEGGDALHLSEGDKIRAQSTTNNVVDYFITGVSES